MNTESGIDKEAINENIRQTIERVALRNVRKLADELEAEQAAKRRLEKRALIIAFAVGTVFAVGLVVFLISGDEKFERGRTIQLPDKVVVPQKN